MKKRFFALLLVLAILLSSSSCTVIIKYQQDQDFIANTFSPGTTIKLEDESLFENDERVITQIEERFALLDDILKTNSLHRAESFVTLFNDQVKDLQFIEDQMSLAYISYCLNTKNNTAFKDHYDELSELHTDYSARLVRMYRTINESKLRDVFFTDEGEKVEDLLKLADFYSDETVLLLKERDGYIHDYQEMNPTNSGFAKKSAELYEKIVDINYELAKKAGYDSYTEYAYAQYGRDFSKEDSKKVYDYVKEYIVPHLVPLFVDVKNRINKNASLATNAQTLYSESFTLLETEEHLKQYYNKYAELGFEEQEESYYQWKEDTVVSTVFDASQSAYTVNLKHYGKPLCFYGTKNHTLTTYLHELGHYQALLRSPDGFDSLDLCETHSQGNEWLYFAYMRDARREGYEGVIKYCLLMSMINLTLSVACEEFEQYVYTHPELTAKDYDKQYEKILTDLGLDQLISRMDLDVEGYWCYAVVENPHYYLSYALAMTSSVELYMNAREDGIATAFAQYDKLSTMDCETAYLEALDSVGLTSPFEESLYAELEKYLIVNND